MKKVLRWLAVLGPIVLGTVVTYVCAFLGIIACSFALGFQMALSGEMKADTMQLGYTAMNLYLENAMLITFLSQILNLIIFVILYRLMGYKKFVNPCKVVKWKNVGVIALVAVGMQLLTNIALSIVAVFAPETINQYSELMEMAGLDELTVVTVLATVIMAPLVEELMFRGVTMKLLEKAGAKFWLANIIQAVLFGVYHMNLVQGVYAAVLGLVLGYLGRRYKTLWAPMLMHLVFNGSSLVISAFAEYLPENIITYIGFVVVGVICMVGAFLIARTEKQAQVEEMAPEVA